MKKAIFPIVFVFIALQSYSQGLMVKRIQDLPSEATIDTSSVTICIDDSTSPSHTWAYKKVSFGQIERQFGGSQGSGGGSYSDTVIIDTITSAQILNSYSSPVTLLPAPGVGWQWNVMSEKWQYIYNTAPYTISFLFPSIGLFEGDTLNSIDGPALNTMLTSTQNKYVKNTIGNVSGQNNSFYNSPITFYSNKGLPPTGGDGFLILTIIARKTH